jgi:hypothetical protein
MYDRVAVAYFYEKSSGGKTNEPYHHTFYQAIRECARTCPNAQRETSVTIGINISSSEMPPC